MPILANELFVIFLENRPMPMLANDLFVILFYVEKTNANPG